MTAQPLMATSPAADLVPLSEVDLSETAKFIAKQSNKDETEVEARLRWFLLENPARRTNDPLGFGLRSVDRLAGCILLSPQFFCFQASKLLLMGSSSFYVDEQHRGQGGRIFLQYCRLGKALPLFGTSANPEAAALWKAAGASPLPYSDGELFGVLHWPPVAEEFAHRKYASDLLTRLARSPISNLAGGFRPLKIDSTSGTLRRLTNAEQTNGLPIQHPSARLTSLRDLAYMRWRYFSGYDPTTAVFAFPSREQEQEILVAVNERARGYRGQIKTLNVLDVYPEVSANEWQRIVGALTGHYGSTIDAIVLRSLNTQQQELFVQKGFQARAFESPNAWLLDRKNLLPTRDWYPVPADGDGLI